MHVIEEVIGVVLKGKQGDSGNSESLGFVIFVQVALLLFVVDCPVSEELVEGLQISVINMFSVQRQLVRRLLHAPVGIESLELFCWGALLTDHDVGEVVVPEFIDPASVGARLGDGEAAEEGLALEGLGEK